MKALWFQEVMNIARMRGEGLSASVALCQCLQQCLGILEVGRVEPFGEPAVDRGQQGTRFGPLALLLPEAPRLMAARSSSDFTS